jgi:hypothetical protein
LNSETQPKLKDSDRTHILVSIRVTYTQGTSTWYGVLVQNYSHLLQANAERGKPCWHAWCQPAKLLQRLDYLFKLLLENFDLEPAAASAQHDGRGVRAEDPVPDHEEGLREVAPPAAALVVHVVVRRVVGERRVQRVPRRRDAAVVVHALDGGEYEEGRGGARGHARGQVRRRARQRLREHTVDGVPVLRRERVGRGHAVVPRVEPAVHVRAGVHQPVHEVLPRVQHQHGHAEPPRRDQERLLRRLDRRAASILSRQLQYMNVTVKKKRESGAKWAS